MPYFLLLPLLFSSLSDTKYKKAAPRIGLYMTLCQAQHLLKFTIMTPVNVKDCSIIML